MKYYIADLHFGHGNLNQYMDHRGFSSVEEMNEYMIQQWNSVVKAHDEVYILGDLFWKVEEPKDVVRTLNRMHGKKYLIRGNHDSRWLSDYDNEKYHCFKWIKDYAEISDNKRRVLLFHYPIMSYNHQFSEKTWMLYGHIHFTQDVDLVEAYKDACKKDIRVDEKHGITESPYVHMINCFCVASDYKPLTLDQWIEMEESGKLKRVETSNGVLEYTIENTKIQAWLNSNNDICIINPRSKKTTEDQRSI